MAQSKNEYHKVWLDSATNTYRMYNIFKKKATEKSDLKTIYNGPFYEPTAYFT